MVLVVVSCVISKHRFLYLLKCYVLVTTILDNEDVNEYDKTAPISFIFVEFINNCRNNYKMDINATIDEILIAFP